MAFHEQKRCGQRQDPTLFSTTRNGKTTVIEPWTKKRPPPQAWRMQKGVDPSQTLVLPFAGSRRLHLLHRSRAI